LLFNLHVYQITRFYDELMPDHANVNFNSYNLTILRLYSFVIFHNLQFEIYSTG